MRLRHRFGYASVDGLFVSICGEFQDINGISKNLK